ncbi:MAG TPA: tetratricopeptide repeat protein [Anaeromyxobacter sp.]|nr:tetratricopeptide repeat protein [Anaeromyxobacter sp.]
MSLSSRSALAAAAVAGGVAFLFAFHQIYDPDFWWHLATGRWILANGRIPHADPFSFATAGAPWVPHSWLPAIGMALLYGKWGAAGIVVAKALVVAAGFGLAVLLAARAGVHPWLAALAAAAAVPVTFPVLQERPAAVMFVLLPTFYWLLATPGAERRVRTWAVLLPLMALWVNVHGSFLFAVAFAGLLATERAAGAAAAALRKEPADVRGVLLAAGLTLALGVLTLASPFGLELPRQMIHDVTAHALLRTAQIQEYQPIVWSERPGFAALVLATGASFVAAWRRPRVYPLVAYAAFVWVAAHSVRFLGAAGIVLAGILAWNLQPVLDRLARRVALPRPWLQGAAATLAIGVFAAASLRAVLVTGGEARFGAGVNEGRFPGPAVRFLSEAGFEGNLFDSWDLGGYVLWHLPRARPLVDGRALPAQFELLERLESMDAAALERWIGEHDVKGALLLRQDPFAEQFARLPRFQRAFFDDRAVVFLRDDAAPRGGGAVARYRFIRPEAFDPSYLAPIALGADAAAAEEELRRAVAAAPDTFQPRFLLGFFLEVRGDPEAIDHYVAAARASPGLAFAHYQLGIRAGRFALATGRAAAVEPLLRQALEVQGKSPELQAMLATSLYVQRRLPEAEEQYRRALAVAPDLELALSNLGYLYTDTGRARLAVPLFERARRVAPGSENAAYGLAYALEAAGDRPGAARAWRTFLSEFPDSGWAPKARARLAAAGGGR